MAAGKPSDIGVGDDGFAYEGVKLQTAEEYKQHRKVQAIIDAQETVLERRETAYEYYWEGRIEHRDYLKALRMGVERYLMLSEQAIRENELSQWFWRGEPPTRDKRSPFNDSGEMVAIEPGQSLTHPDTGEEIPHEKLDNPVLVTGDHGQPIFGTDRNLLGVLPMPEVDRQLVFQGLESYWQAGDPIRRQSESVEEHPIRLRESKSDIYEYQIPEDVSLEAFRQINEFWWQSGMSIDLDRGQTIIRNFDMSTQPEYMHTEGSPPV